VKQVPPVSKVTCFKCKQHGHVASNCKISGVKTEKALMAKEYNLDILSVRGMLDDHEVEYVFDSGALIAYRSSLIHLSLYD
jgi:hypothetical protein